MIRILRTALVLLALLALLSAQTWFSFGITTGGNLQIAGFEAYPYLSGILLVDFLAIALVLYIRKKWAVIFLAAGALSLGLALFSTLAGAFGFDLSVAAPIIEKTTGVATWFAQLESIIVSQSTSAVGGLSWVLALSLLILHLWGIYKILKEQKRRISERIHTASRDDASQETDATALWSETSSTP